MKEKAILVTLDWKDVSEDPRASAAELEELSQSAGLQIAQNLIFPMREPNATFFIGRGKAEELAQIVKEEEANVLVIDADLSATQQRNLEEIVDTKTIDRTQLILDIFAQRAKSNEGKLQVELAQLKYLLPRLSGQGILLSRLGGGVGTRGPGEQKLEMDRRRMREKIQKLSAEIKKIQARRSLSIERKKEKNFPLICLVGYTNAGKSTLFNRLTAAGVLSKDQLFSTLDTTTRLVVLPGNQKALLADTVGFVKRLPHHLVESFRATLEEAVHADLVLHVVDASRSDIPSVLQAVHEVLAYLKISTEKTWVIFNKIDQCPEPVRQALQKTDFAVNGRFLSAKTGEGLGGLLLALSHRFSEKCSERIYVIPKSDWGLVHWCYENGEVLERQDGPGGARIRVILSDQLNEQFAKRYPHIRALSKDA